MYPAVSLEYCGEFETGLLKQPDLKSLLWLTMFLTASISAFSRKETNPYLEAKKTKDEKRQKVVLQSIAYHMDLNP